MVVVVGVGGSLVLDPDIRARAPTESLCCVLREGAVA